MLRLAALLAAAIALIALAAPPGRGPATSAVADPVVSVDAVSDGANTATQVGPIDPCLSTTSGATPNIDIVIQSVTGISGFQAQLLYDPLVTNVTSVSYSFLLSSTFAGIVELGDSVPDSDGTYKFGAVQFPSLPASGAGVLARIRIQTVGAGVSPLDLTNVKLSDGLGNPIAPSDPITKLYLGPVNDARVAVDSSCSSDADGDTVPDSLDNCPAVANSDQTNTDLALQNLGASVLGDALGDACDSDDDNDGFGDAVEAFNPATGKGTGTTVTDNCFGSPGAGGDAWPVDMSPSPPDKLVNIVDVGALRPVFASTLGDGRYVARRDLTADGTINIIDVGALRPYFMKSCAP